MLPAGWDWQMGIGSRPEERRLWARHSEAGPSARRALPGGHSRPRARFLPLCQLTSPATSAQDFASPLASHKTEYSLSHVSINNNPSTRSPGTFTANSTWVLNACSYALINDELLLEEDETPFQKLGQAMEWGEDPQLPSRPG